MRLKMSSPQRWKHWQVTHLLHVVGQLWHPHGCHDEPASTSDLHLQRHLQSIYRFLHPGTSSNAIWQADNPIVRKKAHGKGHYNNYSCFVLEQESWIGAIDDNTQKWGIDQIYGPGTKNGKEYYWESVHKFSAHKY